MTPAIVATIAIKVVQWTISDTPVKTRFRFLSCNPLKRHPNFLALYFASFVRFYCLLSVFTCSDLQPIH